MSRVTSKAPRPLDEPEPAWDVAYLFPRQGQWTRAQIPEYWIVDPREKKVTVLCLAGKRYVAHGEFTRGMTATSHLLPGFTVDVTQMLDQQLPQTKKGRRGKQPRS